MNTKPGCVGCKWAWWDMAGRTRITANTNGECNYPLPPMPVVPVVFKIEVRRTTAIYRDFNEVCPLREEV